MSTHGQPVGSNNRNKLECNIVRESHTEAAYLPVNVCTNGRQAMVAWSNYYALQHVANTT